ncbi:MAG: NADH-quinone oxidoreductase subunit K [Micrococcaceae bacterium]
MSELTLWLGALLAGIALIRLLTVEEPLARLIALNITGGGTLMILVGLAVRSETPDPVPQALALTGIVITVAFTGVGLVLLRAVHEEVADLDDVEDTDDAAGTEEQESR